MARRRAARVVPLVLGVVLLVVGGVWMTQGLGLLPGSPMTGVKVWFWFGLAAALFGLALLMAGIRHSRVRRG